MDSFIKTEQQRSLLMKIEKLKPVFQQRESNLDKLGSFPFENFEDLKKIGYFTSTLPKEFGGQGLGLYDYILAQEAISEGCGSTGLSIGWHAGIVLEYAENRHWNEENAEWLLKEIKKGALINTCATEKNAGSPTRGALPKTHFVKKGEHLIVNGEKTYCSLAPILDYFLVTATNEEDTVEVVVIPKHSDGLTIQEDWDMVAMRGTASHTLLLENVKVPKENILRKKQQQLSGWQLHIPACYIGIAAAARSHAVKFAASYVPASLGKSIAETPTIRQLIGEMELELKTARQLLYATIHQYEDAADKTQFDEAFGITKIAVTNAAISIVDKAMKIVGSRALSQSSPMHRYYMNVRAGLYNPPMEDMMKAKMANEIVAKLSQKER